MASPSHFKSQSLNQAATPKKNGQKVCRLVFLLHAAHGVVLLREVVHVLGQLPVDVVGQHAHVGKERPENGKLLLEKFNLLLEPLVLPGQDLDAFLRFPGSHLGLFPGFPDGHVVPLAPFPVLVRVPVHALLAARSGVGGVRLEVPRRYCEGFQRRQRLVRRRTSGSGNDPVSGVHAAVHDEGCHRVGRAADCAVGVLLVAAAVVVVVQHVLLLTGVVLDEAVGRSQESSTPRVASSAEMVPEFTFDRLLLDYRLLLLLCLLLLLLHVTSEGCSAVDRSGHVREVPVLKVRRRLLTSAGTGLTG